MTALTLDPPILPSPRAHLLRARDGLMAWIAHQRARHQLAQLSSHLLTDIGVDRHSLPQTLTVGAAQNRPVLLQKSVVQSRGI